MGGRRNARRPHLRDRDFGDRPSRRERPRDALDIDSLDFVRLLEQLQNLTGVTVPESDYAKIVTLHELTTYVETHAV